jgi:hypothetical protein
MNGRFRLPPLVLLVLLGASSTPGQTAAPPATTAQPAPAPEADLGQRLEPLDGAIEWHLDAGRIAEAVPPAREKLDRLERRLGKDHWRAGDARRDLKTYTRLAGRPGEVRDRYLKARRADARAEPLSGRGAATPVVATPPIPRDPPRRECRPGPGLPGQAGPG